jgi:putative ABC transport system permease protein
VTVSPFDSVMGNLAFIERYASSVLDWLSLAALVLAAVGLFSALACTVDRRMPEFGIRMALGATPGDINRLVLFKGLMLAGAGVVIGAASAVGLTRFMQSLLFETTPYDPIIYVASGVLLLSVAAAACWLPAKRASRTDVTRLLRAE